MTRVALQPAANPAARRHFEDTIETSIPIDLAARYLPASTVAELEAAHPSGELKLWGAKPGERSQQVTKWGRLRAGDYIAFAADGRLFAGAVITNVFRSAPFARELWGETATANGHAQTWELMFSVAQIESLDVSYAAMNHLIGRSPRANVQEFAVLDEEASAALLHYMNREENSFEGEEVSGVIGTVSTELDGTDAEVMGMRRREQRAIKSALLGRSSRAKCDLCGDTMEVEFLTAAHIKRRSVCSDDERRRLTAVAMLNCRFGCDELFGKGYVGIDGGGIVRVSDLLADGSPRNYALQRLAGRVCQAWTDRDETRSFFAYHWAQDFRRPVLSNAEISDR